MVTDFISESAQKNRADYSTVQRNRPQVYKMGETLSRFRGQRSVWRRS